MSSALIRLGKRAARTGKLPAKTESREAPAGKKFRAARKKQLKQWHEEHPNAGKSAAQHLGKPIASTKAIPSRAKRRDSTEA
jgi:hypothetical protein